MTIEDAEMMARMSHLGDKIVVRLSMAAKTLPEADSFNTVAEIRGSEHPEQVGRDLGKWHPRTTGQSLE